MTAPAIRLTGVSRRFGRTTALDDVTTDVPSGVVCGLLGRNGAGKTTLMSILAGHDRPSTGAVEVLGSDPFEHARVMGSVSLVRDNQRYPEDFKLRHVLRVAPRFHERWDADLAAALVDDFRLPARTTIKKMSRGQQSGVGIVIGLASRAPVTIFDEPYLGLDATARRIFADRLLASRFDGAARTIVLSTHLIDEMEQLLDHVLVLNGGRLVRAGATDEVTAAAWSLSGPADAALRLAGGRAPISTRRIGGLVSLVFAGPEPEGVGAEARAAGLQVAPVSLQDLVAALGADEAAPTAERAAA
ncbi:ABC transporter ATP-binding protein [Amnibacterium kyonggiense]|uniref:ABC-2 type transport system ATP-binding protein n=1 Tax=Amnibacterium kyonggiense TaxID=595671 RepID=A0A4R7FFG7_9MICO|nr:ABC transporter ATP-binding protein [Amnibacterium kyonggiense]TDS76133.1 ABC-2 type transport system ATP-binding protein [Amnibacterium kyonggiense]